MKLAKIIRFFLFFFMKERNVLFFFCFSFKNICFNFVFVLDFVGNGADGGLGSKIHDACSNFETDQQTQRRRFVQLWIRSG